MTKSWLKIVLLVVLVFSLSSLSARAFTQIYKEGGNYMHIILAILVAMFVLAIVKFWQLSIKEKLDTKNFYLRLKGFIKNDQYAEAVKFSEQFKKTTMGHMFWNGLISFKEARESGKSGKELENALNNGFDEAGLQLQPKIESGLIWFDIFAQVATLIGLLGTIAGLMDSFDALGNAPEAQRQQLLTDGISKAMGTTFFGLVVAIITYFVKGFFQGKVKKINDDIDEYSVKIMNQILIPTKKG